MQALDQTAAPAAGAAAARRGYLGRADVGWMLLLMGAGLVLRLAFYSGVGLDDDHIFWHNVVVLAEHGELTGDNISYRLPWLGVSAASCRLLGCGEAGLITPITTFAVLGIGVVYAIGAALWGTVGGVVAALLLLVHPLDFAWSTMLTNDVVVSVLSALTMLGTLRALEHPSPRWRSALWIATAVGFWLSVLAKLSCAVLLPVIAIVCWIRRRRVDRRVAGGVLVAGVLFAATGWAYHHYRGDVLAPYHAELRYQGLVGPDAPSRAVTAETLWIYPELLFWPDRLGDFLFAFYPHVLVALVLLALPLRLSSSWEMAWWFLLVFLGMELNIQRADGVWIAGFRNVRHGHVFVHPFVLLLAGYLVSLRASWPRAFAVLLAALLATGAWQSVSTASKTRESFADMRAACHFLRDLPRRDIYADGKLPTWCMILRRPSGWPFRQLDPSDRDARRRTLEGVTRGYLVTGGGREPHYGCRECIVSVSEIDTTRWRLLREWPGPATPLPWRPEPLRIWEAVGPPA